ncbi:MAG: hypothetical protein WKF61_06440 [Luteimonas sp.]
MFDTTASDSTEYVIETTVLSKRYGRKLALASSRCCTAMRPKPSR